MIFKLRIFYFQRKIRRHAEENSSLIIKEQSLFTFIFFFFFYLLIALMCFAKTNGKIPNSEQIACITDLTQKRDEKAAIRR